MKRTIENGMTLGFALNQLSNVEGALQRAKNGDTQILSIEATDMSGAVVWTAGSRAGDIVPIDWVVHGTEGASRPRFTETERDYAAGVLLEDHLNRPAGALIIRYSKDYALASLNRVLGQQGRIMAGVLAAGAVLILLTVRGLLDGFTRNVRAMSESLQPPQPGAPTPAVPAASPAGDADSLLADLDRQLAEYRRAVETALAHSPPGHR